MDLTQGIGLFLVEFLVGFAAWFIMYALIKNGVRAGINASDLCKTQKQLWHD